MDNTMASRARFRSLLENFYSKCEKCQEEREEEQVVLLCVHVVCKVCVRQAIDDAIAAANLPKGTQPTKYKNPRRFQCPVCRWPLYQPHESDRKKTYPPKLPLHADLLAIEPSADKDGDRPLTLDPDINANGHHHLYNDDDFNFPADVKIKAKENPMKTQYSGYETRQGDYVYDGNIGDFGSNCEKGQMTQITGLAVDEVSDPRQPLVVVAESKHNTLLSFQVNGGNLEQARKAKVRIRDVCIGERGTIVASVAEENYALAKWDSALTISGVRHENLFRDIYGHSAQIASEPFGVARDSRGRYLVTMLAKDRVCRWDERTPGDHIYWFGDSGRHNMGFLGPYYVAKMSNDFTVVSSTADHKVKVVDEEKERLVRELGGLGSDLPNLCYPRGVCVDSDDNIYIADTGNFRVVVYDREGSFQSCAVSETWNYGSDVKPTNVAVLRDGRLLVAMQGRGYCRVHVYSPKRKDGDAADAEAEDECECWWCACCWPCSRRSRAKSREKYETLD